jgi:flavin-dependent dehydrogenase
VEKSGLPRYKVCGCCLSSRSLATLRNCGLASIIEPFDAPTISSLLSATKSRRLTLPVPQFRSLSRDGFDIALVAAAISAGASCLPSTAAKVLPSSNQATALTVELGTKHALLSVESQVVVVADGLGGTALSAFPQLSAKISRNSKVGIGALSRQHGSYYQSGTIYMACGESGYVGLVKLEDGSTDIAAALNAEYLRAFAAPSQAIEILLRQCQFDSPSDLHQLSFKGTVPLTRHREQVSSHRLFITGDAAAYVEPFTGEGIAWALESAVHLAPLVVKAAAAWDESYIWRWQHIHRRTIKSRQSPTKIVAALLASPFLAQTAIDTINAIPGLDWLVSQSISGSPTQERLCLPS